MELVDELTHKFKHYLRTGKILPHSKQEIGYLKHALAKCEGGTDGHPLFALWVVETSKGAKIDGYLTQIAKDAKERGLL